MKGNRKKARRDRSPIAEAMRKRFPRQQRMRHRAARRPKDSRNHWSQDQD